jgi:radical SAM superfamily enzyme YgiQ (UPF0313 family)
MKPVDQVVREIKEYEKYNEPGIMGALKKGYFFVDDNLYVNREYVKELVTALKDLNIKWDAQGTMNMALDEEMLTLMAESGCRSLGIGFESISQESLKAANKPKVNDVKDYAKVIQNIASKGIIPTGFFVLGFDPDDVSVFKKTLEFIGDTDLIQIMVSILTPYVGTRLYDRLKPRIFDTSFYHYDSRVCVYTPERMTVDQLQQGLFWLDKEVGDLNFMRKQLTKFWNHGPWKNNPRLTFGERIILIGLGIMLGFNGLGKYQRFVFWAARQKNAADLQTIVWTIRRFEIREKIPDSCKNPAI